MHSRSHDSKGRRYIDHHPMPRCSRQNRPPQKGPRFLGCSSESCSCSHALLDCTLSDRSEEDAAHRTHIPKKPCLRMPESAAGLEDKLRCLVSVDRISSAKVYALMIGRHWLIPQRNLIYTY